MMKIVVDTNVWLSLILTNQLPLLYNAVQQKSVVVFASKKLREELLNVLQYKKFKGRFLPMLNQYIQAFDLIVCIVEPSYTFANAPDPNDNYLFDICREARAHYLVTGDRILLAMKSTSFPNRHKTEVLSFSRFREMLKEVR